MVYELYAIPVCFILGGIIRIILGGYNLANSILFIIWGLISIIIIWLSLTLIDLIIPTKQKSFKKEMNQNETKTN